MHALAAHATLDRARADLDSVRVMLGAMRARARGGGCLLQRSPGASLGVSGDEGHGAFLGRRLAVVLDGRIDNRDSLVELLRLPDTRTSDVEVVAAAYLRWPEEFASYLLGDFAIILFDEKRNNLIAVRDHFGVKPIYYAQLGSATIVASEEKALFAAGVSSELRSSAIVNFLAGLPNRAEETNFKDVRCLPPGSMLILDHRGQSVRTYWRLELELGSSDVGSADAPEHLRSLLQQAVTCRLPATRSFGVMLSGGLDSSTMACLARRAVDQRMEIETYSNVYDSTPEHNERPYIEAVLGQGGFNAHFIHADDVAPFDGFAEVIEQHSGPPLGPNAAAAQLVYAHAAKDGVHVLIDGHGGDEVISFGHGKLMDLVEAGRLFECWLELRPLARLGNFNSPIEYARLLRDYLVRPWVRRMGLGRRRRSPLRPNPDPLALFRHETVEAFGLAERPSNRRRFVPHTHERSQHFNLLTTDLQAKAFGMLDLFGARFGIESRYPFWDKRVVEFCFALPADLKVMRGVQRRVLRDAMRGVIPDRISDRHDKFDFTARIVGPLVLHHDQLITDVLRGDSRLSCYLDLEKMRDAYARLKAGTGGGYDLQWVWRSVAASLWFDWSESRNIQAAI